MPDRPTVHVTNWSSRRLHGPGRRLSIQAFPPAWCRESMDGVVPLLQPDPVRLMAVRRGTLDLAAYRAELEARWDGRADRLAPGRLAAQVHGSNLLGWVQDGDTLLCTCAVAVARRGECHRAWAAPFLVRAGWRVVLDGVTLDAP